MNNSEMIKRSICGKEEDFKTVESKKFHQKLVRMRRDFMSKSPLLSGNKNRRSSILAKASTQEDITFTFSQTKKDKAVSLQPRISKFGKNQPSIDNLIDSKTLPPHLRKVYNDFIERNEVFKKERKGKTMDL